LRNGTYSPLARITSGGSATVFSPASRVDVIRAVSPSIVAVHPASIWPCWMSVSWYRYCRVVGSMWKVSSISVLNRLPSAESIMNSRSSSRIVGLPSNSEGESSACAYPHTVPSISMA
jgi:hypothetical protein